MELFKKGKVAYRNGDFELAVKSLTEAYGLVGAPALLYNLARALEGLGDLPKAIAAYEKYLETAGEISDRGSIALRTATLKKQLQKQELLEQETKEAASLPAKEEPELIKRSTSSPIDQQPGKASALPWIVAGGGGAVIATGFVFGTMAKSKHNAAVAEMVQAEAFTLQQDAEKMGTMANVLLIAGGAVAVSGVVWALLSGGSSDDNPEQRVTVRPVVGPSWVGVRGQF